MAKNYLFKLSRTLVSALLIIKPELLIIYEFPRNGVPARIGVHTHVKLKEEKVTLKRSSLIFRHITKGSKWPNLLTRASICVN